MANKYRLAAEHKKASFTYRTRPGKLSKLHRIADKKGISLNRLLEEITSCLLHNPKCLVLRRRLG